MKKNVDIPEIFQGLFRPRRYKVYFGGRGGGKSWALGRALLLKALQGKYRILCAREFQSSISDSVHHLLDNQIMAMDLNQYFTVNKTTITSVTGSTIIFKGIRMNPQEIKSTEDIDICWVEEAQSVSDESWKVLTPTIRKENSEIWISFNPLNESDPTYQRFIINPQPDSIVQKVNWNDNPYFPRVLDSERLHMLNTDPDAYNHIWGGDVLKISNAIIFKNKFEVSTFNTPDNARFYHGVDWGFAQDPTVLTRCFIDKNTLYIDREAYGIGIDLDDIPQLFDSISTARQWPLKADNSRPETISYISKKKFSITAADKWHGSVEDGISYLRKFDKIIIHERCKHTIDEFRLYSYKVDKQTGDILPIIIDKHNHCIDSLRYALDGLITRSGDSIVTWSKLANG